MGIPSQEYVSRLSRLRQSMETEGLDGALVYSWRRGQVRYVSGYAPNYLANVAMIVVPRREEPTLFIRFPFDLQRAQAMTWLDDVRASGDVGEMVHDVASRLRELHLDHSRIGLVSGDDTMDELPYTVFQQLSAALPTARFCDARRLVMDMRLTKSPAEFSALVKSAAVADAAVAAAQKLVTPGVSERAVVCALEEAARAAGAGDCLVVIASRSGEEQVGPPDDTCVEAGQAVIIEAAVQVEGYWTQVARTFAVGAPSAGQQAIYDATAQAYGAAVRATTLGARLEEIHAAAQAVLAAAGYAPYVKHDMGHGIGLDLPEPPRLEQGARSPIQAGMALVIHPAVRVPGIGGAFVGGTVLATEEGPVPLHHIAESFV